MNKEILDKLKPDTLARMCAEIGADGGVSGKALKTHKAITLQGFRLVGNLFMDLVEKHVKELNQ